VETKEHRHIDFLVPENIKIDILLMFLLHLVAKIWAELDFQNSMAAILDFVNFKHVPGNRKKWQHNFSSSCIYS